MKVTRVSAEVFRVDDVDGLDPIHVFWLNKEPGQGYVTIICYGCAWTAYFGGMMGKTIQEFFADVDVDYMVNKMGYATTLKAGKRHDDYLAKIIRAVRKSLQLPVCV